MSDLEQAEVVEAIHDLTRVIIALNGGFDNKAATIRKLSAVGIPSNRIGAIMGIPTKDVSSEINHAKKREDKNNE